MDENKPSGTTEPEAWERLQELIEEAAARPSRERHVLVGKAAIHWARLRSSFPRDVTSHSDVEAFVYKENDTQTIALDHLGRQLVADKTGGYTVAATLDEERLDAGDDGD
jgi:hypothetical protein